MPRYPRKPENKGLPTRWQFYHGAYYYRVPPGFEHLWDDYQRFPLGKSLPDAYKKFAERIDRPIEVASIGKLLDRYALQVVPKKSPKTQAENARHIQRLRETFGDLALDEIEPQHIYRYVDGRGAKTAAHREIEVLSHAFTKAVEWGCISRHPFKGEVRLEGEPPRTRYVYDWEVAEALNLSRGHQRKGSALMCQAYIRLKLATGLARSDLLRLDLNQHFTPEGIVVTRHKTRKTTGKTTIYEWNAERFNAVVFTLAARPVDISPALFCNKRGEKYIDEEKGTAYGFESVWHRFMDRVLAETKVTERFTEHDLRAKVGSDAKDLEEARKKLQHADSRTTVQVYRRKPERV